MRSVWGLGVGVVFGLGIGEEAVEVVVGRCGG